MNERVRTVLALTDIFIVGGNSDSRQVAIRRSLLQVFCAYFAKYLHTLNEPIDFNLLICYTDCMEKCYGYQERHSGDM